MMVMGLLIKFSLLLLSLFFCIESSLASITVKVGQYSTLKFEVNETDTNTVKLIKCDGGYIQIEYPHNNIFCCDDPVVIPEKVMVNGVEKTVTHIGDNDIAHNPVFEYCRNVIFPYTTQVIGRYGLSWNYAHQPQGSTPIYDFSKVTSLEHWEVDFKDYLKEANPYSTYPYPPLNNLTIMGDMELTDDFPFTLCNNLQFNESSTVYTLRDGCVMPKNNASVVEVILRQSEVCIPNTVKLIKHGIMEPVHKTKPSTHVVFEKGCQLETINSTNNFFGYCTFDEFPQSVKHINQCIQNSEFATFTLPENLEEGKFVGVTFNEFNLGPNPKLRKGLFSGCTFNSDLVLPDGLTTMEAFSGGSYNGKLILPASFISLHEEEFSGCTFRKELILPNTISNIPARCFQNCRFRSDLILPQSITYISSSAFAYNEFFKNLILPSGIVKIPDSCFYRTTFRNKMLLPESVKEIGKLSFAYANFNSWLRLPRNLKTINAEAFNYTKCNGKIIMPDNATIAPTAFCDAKIDSLICTGSVFDGLGTMATPHHYNADNPAYNNINIRVLDIGKSTPVEEALNYTASDLRYIITHSSNPPQVETLYNQSSDVMGVRYKATLCVPRGSKQLYESTDPWSKFPIIEEFDDMLQGDVNSDDVVDVQDISSLINCILSGNTDELWLDINEDGVVDVKDVTGLINLILK